MTEHKTRARRVETLLSSSSNKLVLVAIHNIMLPFVALSIFLATLNGVSGKTFVYLTVHSLSHNSSADPIDYVHPVYVSRTSYQKDPKTADAQRAIVFNADNSQNHGKSDPFFPLAHVRTYMFGHSKIHNLSSKR